MCMMAAAAFDGGAILATDRRHTIYRRDGSTHRVDAGGRMLLTQSGVFVVGNGSGSLVIACLQALATANPADADGVLAVLDRESADLEPRIDALFGPRATPTRFVALIPSAGAASAVLWSTSDKEPPGRVDHHVSYPPGLEADGRDEVRGILERARATRDPAGMVRALGAAFAYAAEKTASISPTIELAVLTARRGRHVHLGGCDKASAFARATPARLRQLLRPARAGVRSEPQHSAHMDYLERLVAHVRSLATVEL